uniref:Uncharacterized protein n=1 Tax=Candidatus Kentrum sp. LFY TaxID=2126342 RepID=A0A450V1R2_9GAMM|nr:MAG: hypothetical protein BECKLFY1418B_GA0070995_11272 [Candidatus Kentron sp. LFY]
MHKKNRTALQFSLGAPHSRAAWDVFSTKTKSGRSRRQGFRACTKRTEQPFSSPWGRRTPGRHGTFFRRKPSRVDPVDKDSGLAQKEPNSPSVLPGGAALQGSMGHFFRRKPSRVDPVNKDSGLAQKELNNPGGVALISRPDFSEFFPDNVRKPPAPDPRRRLVFSHAAPISE